MRCGIYNLGPEVSSIMLCVYIFYSAFSYPFILFSRICLLSFPLTSFYLFRGRVTICYFNYLLRLKMQTLHAFCFPVQKRTLKKSLKIEVACAQLGQEF